MNGTPLAKTPPPVAAPRFLALRSAHLRAVATRLSRRLPVTLAFHTACIGGLLLASGFPTWRVITVVGIYGAMVLAHVYMGLRARCAPIEEASLFGLRLGVMTAQAAVFALTGGLASPLLPAILAPTIGMLFAFGRSRESVIITVYLAMLVLALGALPASVSPVPAAPYNIALSAAALLFSIYMLYIAIIALTDAYLRAGETLERMREDVVRDTANRTRSLEAIGSKVAHELKNPLAAIKGLVQLMSRKESDERARERLAVIEEEVTRMEGILRDYLSFSRPLEDLKPERVELDVLVDDVLAVLEARAEQADVRVTRSGDAAALVGDPRRLKEALLNLVANAIEATPPRGEVTVSVQPRREDAEVVIRDTGRGISPEVLARVGTPFFTTKTSGTGLGVSLARTAVMHHGGDMRFASEPGKGTTVTVTLPYQPRRKACDGEAPLCG